MAQENSMIDYDKYTFFWNGPASQWHYSLFVIGNVAYNCAEQYMMAEKARLFKDKEAEQAIMQLSNPRYQKAIGRMVKGFSQAIWEKVEENGKPYCWNVVYKGNLEKFKQNRNMKDWLFSTADTLLVEASPYDKVWGIGLGEDDPKCQDPKHWQGKNWLGEVVTAVREELFSIARDYKPETFV